MSHGLYIRFRSAHSLFQASLYKENNTISRRSDGLNDDASFPCYTLLVYCYLSIHTLSSV